MERNTRIGVVAIRKFPDVLSRASLGDAHAGLGDVRANLGRVRACWVICALA
jgi:hypothetical protein